MKSLVKIFMVAVFFMAYPMVHVAKADESSLQIVESFNKGGNIQNPNDPSTKRKQEIMFIMGIPLLIMLISTAVLGIATGVFGKKLFVAHMVVASLSLCLAVAHAIVGLVWFFPF